MADQKLTDKTELLVPTATDLIHVVDVSDTSGSPEGTSKKMPIGNLPSSGGVSTLVFNRQSKWKLTSVGTYTSQTSLGWETLVQLNSTASTALAMSQYRLLTPFATAPYDLIVKEVVINARAWTGNPLETFTIGLSHYKVENDVVYNTVPATSGNTVILEQVATTPSATLRTYVESFTNVAWDSLVIPKGNCLAFGMKRDTVGTIIELTSCDVSIICEKV